MGPSGRLHVGLNLVFLTPGEQGGMEIYAREVIRRLSDREDLRLTAFVNRDGLGGDWGHGVGERLVDVRATDRKQWVFGEQVLLPRAAGTVGVHLMHSMASTAPLYGRFRRITTVHDLNYKVVPEAHFGIRSMAMRILVPTAAHRSHRVIAISRSTADDLVKYLGIPRTKIDVVAQGVNQLPDCQPTSQADLRTSLHLGQRPVVLTVSAKRPHKNLVRLIQAHARLNSPRPVLILPGYASPHEATLKGLAARLDTLDDVRFLNWVTTEDLEGLYTLATAFAFPSLYEGFGLPALEAMARGVPVLTSDRGSLAEVVGDAALIVDPESVEAIAAGLTRLLADGALRDRLRTKGLARSSKFTWDETARRTADAYYRTMTKRQHLHLRETSR